MMPLVLIIDDDPAMRVLMAKLVEACGHRTLVAEGGHQGLEAFTCTAPDLVVTDLSMPAGEGGELIAELRRRAPAAKILAVSGALVTTEMSPDQHDLPSGLAVDAVLSKPFRAREFCLLIDRLLA